VRRTGILSGALRDWNRSGWLERTLTLAVSAGAGWIALSLIVAAFRPWRLVALVIVGVPVAAFLLGTRFSRR
jgi:hypothetical protein